MRALIFLAAIVLILALVGWITFSKSPGRSSINIETQQIRQDTDRALKSGSKLLRKASDKIENAHEPQTSTSQPATPEKPTPAPIAPAAQ